MRFASLTMILATATGALAAQKRTPREDALGAALAAIKRDPSGSGITHLGSDNVLRSFDARNEVVDAIALYTRTEESHRQAPDEVLQQVRSARARTAARADAATSKPRDTTGLNTRQLSNCISNFCMEDSICKGLTAYGLNCSYCFLVNDQEGNCQGA